MTGEWMSSLNDPVDIVRNVGKKRTPIAGLKVFENSANLGKDGWHFALSHMVRTTRNSALPLIMRA